MGSRASLTKHFLSSTEFGSAWIGVVVGWLFAVAHSYRPYGDKNRTREGTPGFARSKQNW